MAKEQAIDIASSCGMCLESYEDTHLLEDVIQLLHNAIDDDGEHEEYVENPAATTTDDIFDDIDPVLIQRDLNNLRLKKSSKPGIPTYEVSVDKGSNISKTYSLQKNKKSPFILYNDKYIRKSTDLYLLQENFSVSHDRLLRVRANQPEHVHNLGNNLIYPQDHMKFCDLCVFRRTGDGNKLAIGRVIQFSYLQGTKKNREYSADYVDFSKDITNIGAFCNWYEMVDPHTNEEIVSFKHSHVFTQGYIPLSYYVAKISDKHLKYDEANTFSIPQIFLNTTIKDWKTML